MEQTLKRVDLLTYGFVLVVVWIVSVMGVFMWQARAQAQSAADTARAQERLATAHERVASTQPAQIIRASWPTGIVGMQLDTPLDPHLSQSEQAVRVRDSLNAWLVTFPPKDK